MTEKESRPAANGAASVNRDCVHGTEYVSQARARRAASWRIVDGDPWWHEPITAGYEDAAAYLLDLGLTPAPNHEGLRSMWKRGGHRRLDAEIIAERWGLAS